MTSTFTAHLRLPDPRVEVLDEAFLPLRLLSGTVEQLYTGCYWAEGPVWFGDQRRLIWSDVPADRMYYWDEETGDSGVFHELLGPIPLGGFFCNGEVGPVGGKTFLHGYTSAFALFRRRGARA